MLAPGTAGAAGGKGHGRTRKASAVGKGDVVVESHRGSMRDWRRGVSGPADRRHFRQLRSAPAHAPSFDQDRSSTSHGHAVHYADRVEPPLPPERPICRETSAKGSSASGATARRRAAITLQTSGPPRRPARRSPGGTRKEVAGLDPRVCRGQAVSVRSFVPPQPTIREQARAELVWFLRHADALARWPVIAESWALRLEERRLADEAERRGDRPGS